MFASIPFSNLLLVLATVFVLFFLLETLVAAEILSDLQEFYKDELAAAISEGVLVVGLYSAAVFFNRLRRKSKKKVAKAAKGSAEIVDCKCPATERPTPRTEMPTKSAHLKKVSSKVFAQVSVMAEDRARLTELVHSLSKIGDIDGATKAMTILEDTCGPPGLGEYTRFVTMCAKANDTQGAHMWMKRLQANGHSPNVQCFNAVINAHAKQGDIRKAAAVVEEMREAGVDGDTITYNTMIDACTRSVDAVEAQVWMKKMLAAGVKASVVSFGSVMCACAKAGLNSDLEYWVEQAGALGIELNMICFSAVINAFAKKGDVSSADIWLTRMPHCNVTPTVHCFTGMIDMVCRDGNVEHATRIVSRMREFNVKPDSRIYSLLVTAACEAGKLGYAQKLINEAAGEGIVVSRKTKDISLAANLGIPSIPGRFRKSSSGMPSPNMVGIEAPVKCGVDEAEKQACIGKRFVGTVKEFVSTKFGHIACAETYAVFKRDVFLSPYENPEQFAKGQKVSFVLQVDRRCHAPRAIGLKALSK